mmetsp:Transcript_18381/g.29124  ORF Transcript_18381/g.29124 Transcript_18381/m.29124 type:complete len:215 (+) Transcript_18381:438-1082(+)
MIAVEQPQFDVGGRSVVAERTKLIDHRQTRQLALVHHTKCLHRLQIGLHRLWRPYNVVQVPQPLQAARALLAHAHALHPSVGDLLEKLTLGYDRRQLIVVNNTNNVRSHGKNIRQREQIVRFAHSSEWIVRAQSSQCLSRHRRLTAKKILHRWIRRAPFSSWLLTRSSHIAAIHRIIRLECKSQCVLQIQHANETFVAQNRCCALLVAYQNLDG